MLVHAYYDEDPRVRREAESLVAAGRPVDVFGLRRDGDARHGTLDGVTVHRLDVRRHQGAGLPTYLAEYAAFVGRATWAQSMRSLKPGGRLVVCGGTSGADVEVNLPRLFFKQHEIIGSSMGSYQEFAELTALVDGGLDVHVDRVFPLADYAAALAHLEAGEQLGKVVLSHRD